MGIFSRKASTAQKFDAKRIVHRRIEITVEREWISEPAAEPRVDQDCQPMLHRPETKVIEAHAHDSSKQNKP